MNKGTIEMKGKVEGKYVIVSDEPIGLSFGEYVADRAPRILGIIRLTRVEPGKYLILDKGVVSEGEDVTVLMHHDPTRTQYMGKSGKFP